MIKKKLGIIIIIFFILMLMAFINNNNYSKKDKNQNLSSNKDSNVKEDWYKPNGNSSKIEIYYLKTDNSYVHVKENEDKSFIDSTYEYKNTYNCNNSNCKMYNIAYNSYKVVVKDNGYVLYDFNKNKAKKLSLPEAEYNDINILSSNGTDYGLSISNTDDMYAFYSFEEKKFTTGFKYSNIYTLQTDGLSKGYISTVIDNDEEPKYYVINYKNDSVVYETDTYMGIIGNENKVYFYKNYAELMGMDAIIYNSYFKPLFDEETYDIFGVSSSGNIVLKDKNENTFSMYNDEGKMVKTSKEYDEILMIVKDYVIVVDVDGFLKVVDYDGNVKAKFSKIPNDYLFKSEISGLFFDDEDCVLNIYVEKKDKALENGIIKFYYVPRTKENGKIDL